MSSACELNAQAVHMHVRISYRLTTAYNLRVIGAISLDLHTSLLEKKLSLSLLSIESLSGSEQGRDGW